MQASPIERMDGTRLVLGTSRQRPAVIGRSPSLVSPCRTAAVRTPIMIEDVVTPQLGLKVYPSDSVILSETSIAPRS
ncbi:hypothetical protein [Burkholderia ubonensis]|uniref:hypothetical protein n=1 Tax=Burkholderia ubonensis TaxID=101571 RepID=UPI0012FA888D|nr:hypothetical protein [Burkholderia ubonensis]